MGSAKPAAADFEREVRKIGNLYKAWAKVRHNVNQHGSKQFKVEVEKISENPITYLRNIQTKLERGSFAFDEQHGVLKKKASGKKRPIVVASITNRIVQRAILNILQSDNKKIAPHLGEIVSALNTKTSIGGIPERGVACGMKLVSEAIKSGATHYIRSDICDFFTKIPKRGVVDFVREQTRDDRFSNLFEQAILTKLDNSEEVKEDIALFPIGDIGVPQGSSLSAFAGNVILRDFDKQMNGRGITTIRYIDDFVILGPSQSAVKKAFDSARSILEKIHMTAYGPGDDPQKYRFGEIARGFDFLGCTIKGDRQKENEISIIPSREKQKKFLNDIKQTLLDGVRQVEVLAQLDKRRRSEDGLAQILCQIDRMIRGWRDAFIFSNAALTFSQLDQKINDELEKFLKRAYCSIKAASNDGKRKAWGITLLKDISRVILQ